MSSYMGDLSSYLVAGNTSSTVNRSTSSSNISLDMTDFLELMVAELTNQSIDDTADTSDMLNQLVQMQMISAITDLTDASIMSYAASLVGKEVTVGQYDSSGTLQEIVGVVTGTGTMNGSQVVFVNDKYYYMNEIMAVGRLPSTETSGTESGSGTSGETGSVDGAEESGGASDETVSGGAEADSTTDSAENEEEA